MGLFEEGPAPITDDSEQAMCLMHGIIKSNIDTQPYSRIIDCDIISQQYSAWIHSEPFDAEIASRKGAPDGPNHLSYETSRHFKLKGAFMRTTPLAVWVSGQNSIKKIYQAIKVDLKFKNPIELVIRAVLYYHLAIQYLLNNPTDPDRGKNAFKMVY